MTEKEQVMTRDEALDRAQDAYEEKMDEVYKTIPYKEACKLANEARLASLKASGWTLAMTEPTEEMLKLGAMAKAMARQKFQTSEDDVRQIYAAVLTAQEENDER
jgi:hypothetical protein